MAQTTRQQTLATPVAAPRTISWARKAFGPDWAVALPFILPLILLLAGLIAIPFFDAIRLSFTTRQLTDATHWVGLQNYKDLLHDNFFKDAVKNTVVFTTYSEVFKVTAGLIAAMLLHNLKRGKSVLTGLVLLPWIVPTVVTALAWRSIYDPIFGGLNKALIYSHLGNVLMSLHLVDRLPASWLGQQDLAMPSVILVNVWKGIPFFTLNLLAGLKAIDNDLYEAASVDGANSWQKFINVTLPGLRYVILVTTLLSTIWTFNTFDVIYLLTGGGPGGSTRPFVVFAYEKAIQGLQFGPGAAVALIMVPILAVFIFFLARFMRRSEQQVQESGLDRFFSRYGKTLLYVGIALFVVMLYAMNSGMFIRAAAIFLVVLGLGLGFGYLSSYLTDLGEARSRAQGKVRTQTMKERPNILGRLPAWVALAILLFFVLAPFYWMIITAFKSELQVTSQQGNVFWPHPWTFGQFQKLTSEHPFWTWFRNSAIVAICTTLISVTFAALAGYALARLRFRGAQGLTGIVLLTYLVPSALLFIPLYQILSKLHLINTLGSLIITYPTFALPFATWLMMGYFRGIPEELENAAMIDGATRFQAFRRVTLPLATPALLAVALFTFTNSFNEFLLAFVFITKQGLQTLPVGLQSMIFGDIYPYGQLMAGALLMAIPVVVLYSYGQKFLVEGLTAGSVKG
ncbi:MAG: ABC transporter permease subunit [Thermomicrobiales bacterium]